MEKLFILTFAIVGIALILLSIRLLLKRNGEFGSQHIGQSRAMRQRGIHCAQSTDRIEYSSKINVEDMEREGAVNG